MDTLAIIKRIELRLAELGMSKAEFYKLSGISSASYSQWNTGKYKPSESKLRSAAECLGLSFEYLCSGKNPDTEKGPTADGKCSGSDEVIDYGFFDRFKQLCDERGISIYKAATAVGLNRAAANKWKNGSVPNGQTITKLADYFGVSNDYLLGKEKTPANDDERSRGHDVLDEVDIAFYGDFKELTEDDKATVRDMVRIMRERRSKKQE